jgi:predicted ATPase
MARLDRLAAVKALAQLAATLGREFSYALLHVVSPWDEGTVQRGLQQLVEAEFLYQRGLPPQATYTFKHALIQDVAYQSLLRRTRQHYHQRIAQALEAQFPEIVATQPELVAQHYTAAGCAEQAVVYWQRAGERSQTRSAYVEAVTHLRKGLEVLQTLPDASGHARHELAMQVALGQALAVTKGHSARDVEHAYTRARALCGQVGDPVQLAAVLGGLSRFYRMRGALQAAHDLGQQLLTLAQRLHDPDRLAYAHWVLGNALFFLGAFVPAHVHLEHALACAPTPQDHALPSLFDGPARVETLSNMSWALWLLGYPDQAVTRGHEMVRYAQELQHAFSLARAQSSVMVLHKLRGEAGATREWAEANLTLIAEQGFEELVTNTMFTRGWALAMQGQHAEGIAAMHQGLAARRAMGVGVSLAEFPARLGEAYGRIGQAEEGLRLLADALTVMDKAPWYAAEVHRIQGELLLQQTVPDVPQAAACFQQAVAVARRQQAKAYELRATTSLARLWQQQGKQAEARALLAPIYGWFTEGFDTADLQEAKALLKELGE